MSVLIAVIRVFIAFLEFLVVADNVEVQDVDVFDDFEDFVLLAFVFAFLLVLVAISEVGHVSIGI